MSGVFEQKAWDIIQVRSTERTVFNEENQLKSRKNAGLIDIVLPQPKSSNGELRRMLGLNLATSERRSK